LLLVVISVERPFMWLTMLCFQFHETTAWSASFVSMVT
jgi:hypothetical protein